MNELKEGFLSSLSIIPSFLFAITSMIGGRDGKFLGITGRLWKRVFAPFAFVSCVLALALIRNSFSWWLCSLYATYFVSCMVGYGAESLFSKEIRRTVWSLIRTASCLPIVLILGTSEVWNLLILQGIVGWIATVALGVYNPLKAPAEEFLINFISVMFVPFMLFNSAMQ